MDINNKDIAKRYDVIRLLKKNAKSSVYLAFDKVLKRNLAIKKVKKHYNDEESSLVKEASIMIDLDHPSLPKIYDVKEDEDYIYIVEEYIDGDNLRVHISNYGPEEQDTVIRWGIQLCDVIEYLHSKNIIYRDTKPSNIMLTDSFNIKLIDFDTAREYKEGKKEDTESLGTQGYAAPEQYEGNGQTDVRTDIYGIGITLFNLLTGKNPASYKGNVFSIRTVNPELSSGLDRIILKCTERDPKNRYQTVEELRRDLLNYRKLDVSYVLERRRVLKKFYIFFTIGIVSLIISLCFGILHRNENNSNYEKLVSGSPSLEEIEKAITIKPDDTRAYESLLDSFGEEVSSDELTVFSRNYSEGKPGMSKDVLSEVSMTAGEKILSSYIEKSDRAKLMIAYPYFQEVRDNGNKKYEKYSAATLYCNMAEFYKNYILPNNNNSMLVNEAGKEEHEELLANINESISIVKDYEGKENKNLALSLYSVILSLIQSESNSCFESEIDKTELTKIVSEIISHVNTIDSQAILEKKTSVLSLCDETLRKINNAYSKHVED